MHESAITLTLGLLTIVGSGITSSWVTHKLTRDQNQTVYLRQKAEALYLTADEYGKNFASHIISYLPFLDGQYDYDTMLDKQIENGVLNKHGGAETMTMLVEIYFPNARPALQEVWNARQKYNEVTSAIKSAWLEEGDITNRDWNSVFRYAASAVNSSIEELKAEIVKAARLKSGVKQ
jgi:hypothetical protein